MRDRVTLFRSHYEALKALPPDDFKAAVTAILEYGLNDIEPEYGGIAYAMFMMAKPVVDKSIRMAENGMRGGKARSKYEANESKLQANVSKCEANSSNSEANANLKYKDKSIKIKEESIKNKDIKEEKKECDIETNKKDKEEIKNRDGIVGRFTPPTTEEVWQYIFEKGYSVDAERFCAYYQSKGWMVGKTKMKDWKAALRGWEARNKEAPPKYGGIDWNSL